MQATAVVKGLGTLDFGVMGVYLLLVFALGAFFAKQQRSTKDFFLAGRSMGIIPIALSLSATIFSAISFIAGPAAVCIYGLAMLGGTFVVFLMIPIVTKVFIPFYSRLKVYSAYEYLERRFDVRVRCLASGMFIVWRLFWMGLALYSPCLALHSAMGSESQQLLYVMIITLGLVATAYTVMGGMKAVIWTDVVQFCIFFGAIVLAIIYTASHVEGGLAGIWSFAREQGRTRLTAELPAHAEFHSAWQAIKWYFTQPITFWAIVLGTFVTQLGFFCVDQVTLQRFFSSKGAKEASRSFVLNAIGLSTVGLMLSFLGLSLFAFYQGVLPEAVAQKGWDGVFPYFTAHEIWQGVAGLIIAALFAATMSSVDSGINSVSTAVLVDFHQRLILGQRYPADTEGNAEQERRQLVMARWLTIFFGLVATGLACFVKEIGDSIIKITNIIVNNFCGPMLGIFLLGIFSRRASPWGVLISPVLGVLTAFFMTAPLKKFGLPWEVGVAPFWASVIGLVITLVIGYGISLIENLVSGAIPEHKLRGVTWAKRFEKIDI